MRVDEPRPRRRRIALAFTGMLCAIAIVSFYMLWSDVQRVNRNTAFCNRAEIEIFFDSGLGHYSSRMVRCLD